MCVHKYTLRQRYCTTWNEKSIQIQQSNLSLSTCGIRAGLGDGIWPRMLPGKNFIQDKVWFWRSVWHHKTLLLLLEIWLSPPDNKRQIYKPSACWHLSNSGLSSLDWLPEALLVWDILGGPIKNNEGRQEGSRPVPLDHAGCVNSRVLSQCCHFFPRLHF